MVDLFAGAGGWDLAARELGFDPLGIEIDAAACATRAAAGLRTLQADVVELDPADYPCVGLIASPPCPTFSAAGVRAGALLTAVIVAALRDLAEGLDTRAVRLAQAYDVLLRERPRDRARRDAGLSLLVVEPLRWVLALEPEWIALEQVPPVLPLWHVIGDILHFRGYSVWCGVLEAERFGVPQTRSRSILMASRRRGVSPPRPTHQRYVKGVPAQHEQTFDGWLLPWVSMAQALGSVARTRPSPAPTRSGGVPGSGDGGEVSAAADSRARERAVLIGTQSDGDSGEHGVRDADEPAFTVAPNSSRWKLRVGDTENATTRDATEPASTLFFGHHANEVAFLTDTGNTRGGTRVEGRTRAFSEPAPVLTGRADQMEWRATPPADWTLRRPATTITGEPRVPSGHKVNADDVRAGRDARGRYGQPRASTRSATTVRASDEIASTRSDGVPCQATGAVRVTVEQAAVLQSFPPDHPWQGTKTQQYTQVGNAMPPRLASAILEELTAR